MWTLSFGDVLNTVPEVKSRSCVNLVCGYNCQYVINTHGKMSDI